MKSSEAIQLMSMPRTAQLLGCLLLLTLCSCRATGWWREAQALTAIDAPADEIAAGQGRHLSNWDRVHGGQGPPRAAYTHQPRYVELPQMPVPIGPATSQQIAQVSYDAPAIPESAYTGSPYDVPMNDPYGGGGCQGCGGGCRGGLCNAGPNNNCPGGSWRPPGIGCPWPADEYICDGGDRDVRVDVMANWDVRGLGTEDTIAHYDTLQGQTVIEQSNRVCIYAPRFAAVRSVKGNIVHQQMENPLAARDRNLPYLNQEDTLVTSSTQHTQPLGQFGLKPVNIYEGRDSSLPIEKIYVPAGMSVGFLPHEDFRLIRTGVADLAEKARLANAADAAIAWTGKQGVQVALDGKLPVEASNNFGAEQVYKYDFGKSRLRIVKTASKQNAKPGEIIDFTLRFDNIGDQTIGNVTVIDSLTTRLEYVPNSVQSSVAADFFTQENEGESLVLRWEVVEPVKVGKGGVIRFQAKVR